MINKVLRTLLHIYAIRVYARQELICTHGNELTLNSLVGRLIAFELSNFDNFNAPAIIYAFKSQLVLNKSRKRNESMKLVRVSLLMMILMISKY